MSIFDTMEKRHHVVKYKPEPVPEKIVKDLMYKAWKISPSKNNFMPYNVNVIGPHNQEEKTKVWNMVVDNHKFYEEIGNASFNKHLAHKYEFKINPNYEHVRFNSHLIVFTSRVCPEPNAYYKRMVEHRGHYAEQCDKDMVIDLAEATSVEVGLFASHLSGLCIENNIDVSFCACIRKNIDQWKEFPYLWYDKDNQLARVHLIMSIGYGEHYRYQWHKENKTTDQDIKPEYYEIVKWI